MTETGLLIAEAAFLVLLYLFIWSIVRSSSRDLRDAGPVVIAPPPDAVRDGDTGSQDAVVVEADIQPAPVDPAAVAVAPPAAAPDAVELQADIPGVPPAARVRQSGPALDLSVNINPRLVVERSPSLEAGAEYPLSTGMTIGRSSRNGIVVGDEFVSHLHARVFPSGQFFHIEDLGSTNGTFVNGRRIEGQAQLKVRDEISFGETVLRYEE